MHKIALFSFCLLWLPFANAQLPWDVEEWRLDFDREGIRIYTREQPDSDYHAFKAEAVLNVPMDDIMGVMAQPGSCIQWVHNCVESFGVTQNVPETSFNKRYAYSVNDLPWPVRDRDYVIEINTSSDPENGSVRMDMYAVTDIMPENSDYIRVTRQETHYRFEAIDESHTRMIWLQHTDPAGFLPSWLVNALIVDIPFKSMKALEEVAQLPMYKGSRIVRDETGNVIGVTSPEGQQ